MIHIEDEDGLLHADEEYDEEMKAFFEELKEVKQTSQQILNYTYPPILYQRMDEDEDEDEDGLPDFGGDMDDEDIEELIKGGGQMRLHEDEDDDGPYYLEQVDDNGRVQLVEAHGRPMYEDEFDLNEQEFLEQMER